MIDETEDAMKNLKLGNNRELAEKNSKDSMDDVNPKQGPKNYNMSDYLQVQLSQAGSYSSPSSLNSRFYQAPSKLKVQPNLKKKQPNFGYHSHCMAKYTSRSISVPLPSKRDEKSKSCESLPDSWKKSLENKLSLDKVQSTLMFDNLSLTPITMKRRPKSSPKELMYENARSALTSSPMTRLQEEENFIAYTRMLKRLAQIVPHRIDQPYYLCGNVVSLQDRYRTEEEKLNQLKMLFDHHKSRPHSRRFMARFGIGIEISEEDTRPKSSRSSTTKRTSSRFSSRKGSGVSGSISTDSRPKSSGGESDSSTETAASSRKPFLSLASSNDTESSSVFITSGTDEEEDKTLISHAQEKAFSGMFKELDYDENGKITMQELIEGLFKYISKKDMKLLMKIFDLNLDKTIDEKEFIAVCALNDRLCGKRTTTTNGTLSLDLKKLEEHITLYREIFHMIDQDHSGKIHLDEFMFLLTAALGKEEALKPKVVNNILSQIDKDANGCVDFVSFITCIPVFTKLHSQMLDTRIISLAKLEEARIAMGKKFGRQ